MPDQIISRLAAHPALSQAREALKKGGRAALYDMPPVLRLLAAMTLAETGQVLYLLPNERAARQAAEDAQGLGSTSHVHFQPMEIHLLRAVTGKEGSWQRLAALDKIAKGEARLIIASVEALQQALLPRAWYEQAVMDIRLGDNLKTGELAARFARQGYERLELVEAKGQFALRGDILDVYPPALDQPLRVEFFGDQVDSIRSFDPLTQRSMARLETARISPAGEYFVPEADAEEAAARLEKGLLAYEGKAPLPASPWENAPDVPSPTELAQQGSIPDAHLWAHLLFPEDSGLLSWLRNAAVVLDTPDRAAQRLADSGEGYAQMLAGALESGLAHPAQEGLLRPMEEVIKQLRGGPLMMVMELLRGMGGLTPQLTLQLAGSQAENYRGRLQNLAQDAKRWQERGFMAVLFTGGQSRAERLAAALASQGVSARQDDRAGAAGGLTLSAQGISEGFVSETAGLALLAPQELFGAPRTRARQKQTAGQRIEAFTDLSVGDYVVHDHHGIGVYQGTVRLQSEGIWRDYLFIQYRGSDKLYVPADQFDRVQKYIGNPDTAPALNDLSSNTWSKQKSRVKAGLKQLAFDLVQLYAARQQVPGYAFEPFEPFEGQFADQFEHELTPDQEQAVGEVLADMARPRNMDRLLCGDVGYGKTEVAMRAAFRAVMNGKQAALLAPTTILVQQHVRTLLKRFEGFPVRIGYVSRFQSPKENRQVIQEAREGRVDILVGTHRLLSRDVQFKNLGLLIIDEEQRFGVRHKEQIKNLKNTVDVLTLSATPIPRTLHMSMVGVRDMSLLETPPEDRFPVSTFVVDYRDGLIRDAILREINRQGQVFFLYNRVASIERMSAHLRQLVPEARIAVAHGQMPEQMLEDVMLEFYQAKHDVLLCSTIIENGLDIQNANTLIVYDADHFGLSQLYQLRGRVGRSTRAAYAFFTVKADKALSETAEKRLAAIKEFTAFGAGFRIAMRDLEIRGAGNIFGPEQSGQVAAVGYDMYVRMIEEAIKEAQGDFTNLRQSELETRVDLHVNAFLPEHYVRGEAQRIEIYKRIALIRNQADEQELTADLIDRFGEPEQPVMNLMSISRLRALANSLGADQVRFDRDSLALRFHPQYAVDPAALYAALSVIGRRMSLQGGKRTALLVHMPGKTEAQALKAGIRALEGLLSLMEPKKEALPAS